MLDVQQTDIIHVSKYRFVENPSKFSTGNSINLKIILLPTRVHERIWIILVLAMIHDFKCLYICLPLQS